MTLIKYIETLDLSDERLEALRDAAIKDAYFRTVLGRIGILPRMINNVMKLVDLDSVDLNNDDLMIEKARAEWADYIPKSERRF